jgi:mono/diheme cytochrome c family protein
MKHLRTTLCYLPLLLAPSAFAADAQQKLDFSRDIRPILSENCFSCHGQDKHKGDLRLDQPDVINKPAKSGDIAIVPGKPDKSELVRRITLDEADDDHMPPADSHKKLTAAQIETLIKWIAQGAEYKIHWAFVPPVRPAPPSVQSDKWAHNPIDRFILAKLESERLSPSPEADKHTLLRRLYLDLIGLPPTIEEANAFLSDTSPDAYEKLVEKLLASPHYGERWGRHWLDAARYADSDGFEKDKPRYIWFYRDWVINAFNRDLPYNQFVIEQIAGDQLPHPTQDQIVATGFLRNAMLNEEGGVDPEQFRMDGMFDRMDCIGKSILGLTIQCAQCHNHKYDPLMQEEYYKLFAFLNNDNESSRVVYAPPEQQKVADLTRQMREIEAGLRHTTPDWEERMAEWEERVRDDQPQWTVLKLEYVGDNDERYLPQKDGSFLAQGYAPTKHTPTYKVKTDLKNITAFRLELLTDPNLPAGGPGRSFKGTCALTEFGVDAAPSADPKKAQKVKFADATSDYDQPVRDLEPNFYDKTTNKRVTGPVKLAIDGDGNTAWGIDAGPGRRNTDRKAVFLCDKPLAGDDGGLALTIRLKQEHGGWNSDDLMTNNLGRFRISATTAPGKVPADPLPKRVRAILAIPRDRRSPEQTAEVFSYWRTTVPECKEANDRIEALWQQWPNGNTTLVLSPRDGGRETRMLTRGDWLKPTRGVGPGVPAFLHSLPENSPPTRLTLAQWLVDRKSPTTARAFVNRIWQAYFGTGIVGTSEDFGIQSELPSHPQLLDWLAVEFMDSGWSIKHLHRLIVTSATYRQSSRVTQDLLTRDPYNRLLARGPRFRVEGEIVRDIALASSGLLNPAIGGRSVMPPAPAYLFLPPASYAPFPWIDETGPDKYRRAVYTWRRRSTPYPVLQTFDVPNGESSCVRRSRSNSPLQALVSLNEPMFVECAQALAKVTLENGGNTDDQRIAYAFRRVLSRDPNDAERKELLALLDKERHRFADGYLNPNELAAGQPAPPPNLPKNVTPTQWASYTVVSRVLLNLDETITKE